MKPLFDELKFFLRENDLSNELIKKKWVKISTLDNMVKTYRPRGDRKS